MPLLLSSSSTLFPPTSIPCLDVLTYLPSFQNHTRYQFLPLNMKINLTQAGTVLASISPLNTAIVKRAAESTTTVTVTKTIFVTVTGGGNAATQPIASLSAANPPTLTPPVVSIPNVALPASTGNPIVTGPGSNNPPGQVVSVCPTGLQTYGCVVVSFGAGGSSIAAVNVVQVSKTVANGKATTLLSTEAVGGGNNQGTTLRTVTKTGSPTGVNEVETATITAQPQPSTASGNSFGNFLSSILSIISSITHQTSTSPVLKSTSTSPGHATTLEGIVSTVRPKTSPSPPKTTAKSGGSGSGSGSGGGGGKSSKG